jgi:tetratricopeptide (TPR) repeat protein
MKKIVNKNNKIPSMPLSVSSLTTTLLTTKLPLSMPLSVSSLTTLLTTKLLTLLLFMTTNIYSQDLKQTFDFANELFYKKDYKGAAETYRRVIFFDKSDEYRKACYQNIADCLYETQTYEEAADYYELAYFQAKTDSLKAEILFRKTSCFLLENNLKYAEIELFNLPAKLSEEQERRQRFYFAILHFSNGKFKESESTFLSLVDDSLKRQNIRELFLKNEKVSKINPKKAKVLSTILPGMGQFYAGDVKNGLNSFLLVGGILTWGVLASIESPTPLDAVFSMIPWVQRYYTGGIKRAETITVNRIQEKRSRIYNQILDELR